MNIATVASKIKLYNHSIPELKIVQLNFRRDCRSQMAIATEKNPSKILIFEKIPFL